MKKLVLLLAVLFTANVMTAQKDDLDDAWIQYMYARLYVAGNKYKDAMVSYENAMNAIEKCVNHKQFNKMTPKEQADAWWDRASIYVGILQDGDNALKAKAPNALENAFESLKKCLKYPKFMEDSKDLPESMQGFQRDQVYETAGYVINSYYNKGADNYNAGYFSEAVPMFKKAYDLDKLLGGSNANDVLNLAATSAMKAGDYSTALKYFNELKKVGGESVDLYRNLATCYDGMGNSGQAMAMINNGLKKYPNDFNLISDKVNMKFSAGKATEAINDLKKLHEIEPDNAQVLYVLGTIYCDEKNVKVFDTEKAINYFEDAVKIDPNHYDSRFKLAGLYTGKAVDDLNKAENITGSSDADVERYNKLKEEGLTLLEKSLPHLKYIFEAQPNKKMGEFLQSVYITLNMNEEAQALEQILENL